MIRVSVLYPHKEGARFDHDYYANKHMALVRDRLGGKGLVETGIDKGIGTAVPDAPAPYVSIGWMTFNTVEEFQSAFGAHADEIMSDIPNYTDIEPQIQISEIV